MSSEKLDIFRDTPVRLLGGYNYGHMRVILGGASSLFTFFSLIGYANEIGEAFRPLVKKIWVHASYGVAISYVAADTFDKGGKTYKRPYENDAAQRSEVFKISADTLVWQGLASIIIPGFTINRVCAGTLYFLRKATKLPKMTRKWTATAVGIFCIPLIVSPIDHGVHFLMDNSLRKWLGIPCHLDLESKK